MTHQHAFLQFADFRHAPIGVWPHHTAFTVLTCACGAYECFPAENFSLCLPAFSVQLQRLMRSGGFAHVAVLDAARQSVADGGTHDCSEWRSPAGTCALCGGET